MKKTRVDESRAELERAFYYALGGYAEQEAKKDDQWRDQTIGQLYAHLAHEIDEVRVNLKRNDRLTSGRCAFKSEATYDAMRELLQRNGANMHRDHVKVLEDALKDREGCLACEKYQRS